MKLQPLDEKSINTILSTENKKYIKLINGNLSLANYLMEKTDDNKQKIIDIKNIENFSTEFEISEIIKKSESFNKLIFIIMMSPDGIKR